MPRRECIRRRSVGTGLALAIVAGLSIVSAAHAESDLFEGSDRWAPSLLLRSGIVIQSGKGVAESSFPSGAPLRPRTTGRQTQIWPMLGADLELMSPTVDLIPGSPRFFARGGASYSFAGDKDVAKEGNPLPFEEPLPTLASLVDGKGSRTNIELRSPIWEAGLGSAFEFEAGDRLLRLRLSAEWMRQKIDLKGEVRQAIDLSGLVFTSQITGQTSKELDAVGGGIALELDAMRAGDFMTSVYLEQRVYGWVGGRRIEKDGEAPLLPSTIQTTAHWSYKLDPVAYRTHVGFRIRWQPE